MTTTMPTEPSTEARHFYSLPKSAAVRWMIYAFAGVLILSVLRVITDAGDLTDGGTFSAALLLAVPILLAGLGGLFAERVGVVNIGLEGMMVLGTFGAGWAGYEYGAWWGVFFACVFGALGGLLHALATVTFGVDHIISGVAINIIAPGVVRFLAAIVFVGTSGGAITQGPRISSNTGQFSVPFIAGGDLFGWKTPDPLQRIGNKGWFLISDACDALHGLTNGIAMYTLLAVALVPLSAYVLWRTPFGLRLRSIGEKPEAAESLGVNVYLMKYVGVMISGGLAGLGGGILVIENGRRYNEGQTANRGFIGLAALIFGNWRPSGIATGAGLFGFAEALRLRSTDAVLAVILLATVVLALVAINSIRTRKFGAAAISAAVATIMGVYYWQAEVVPTEFQFMTPYVATLLVLVFASKRLRPPAAEGKPWRKGQTT
jgi:general nucleoside transport system permease protein